MKIVSKIFVLIAAIALFSCEDSSSIGTSITQEEVEILDGVDGVSLENIEIVNRNLEVTYGGETENLGQIVPNIQVGTTTTGNGV